MNYQIKRWQMVVGAALSIGILVVAGWFDCGAAQMGTLQPPLGGMILGFEQSLVQTSGSTVTAVGYVNRVSNPRTISLIVDMEKGGLPPGSEITIEPNMLNVTEPDRSLEYASQAFQVTIKMPEGLQPGRYSVSVKAKDEISEVENVLFVAVEGGR